MYSNLIVSIQAVLPIFILIALGMLVRKTGLINAEENRRMNRMVFLIFFSTLVFNNIYKNDIGDIINLKLITFGACGVIAAFIISIIFGVKVERDNKKRGALIQAIFRSNFVILGMPITLNICGEENSAVTAMMIAVVVPIYNFLAVILLEVFRGGKIELKEVLIQLFKNPLLDGAIIGLMFKLFSLKLPYVIEDLIGDMAAVATPMALIILGISFEFSQIKECGRNLWFAVIGRLIVIPAIMLMAGAFLGFRGPEFVCLIGIFAAPTAVASYTMAVSMDSDGVLAGNAVIMSSLISCFTMFGWIFLFKSLGIF